MKKARSFIYSIIILWGVSASAIERVDVGDRYEASTKKECADKVAKYLISKMPEHLGTMTIVPDSMFLKSALPNPVYSTLVYNFSVKVRPPKDKGAEYTAESSVSVFFIEDEKDLEDEGLEETEGKSFCKVAYNFSASLGGTFDQLFLPKYYNDRNKEILDIQYDECKAKNTAQCVSVVAYPVFYIRNSNGRFLYRVNAVNQPPMHRSPRSGVYVDVETFQRHEKLNKQDKEAEYELELRRQQRQSQGSNGGR